MNKVILITGASSGIGKSIGNYLSENGHTVYGTSRNPKKYPKSQFTLVKSDVKKISDINDLIKYNSLMFIICGRMLSSMG